MKKFLVIILALVLAIVPFSGCSGGQDLKNSFTVTVESSAGGSLTSDKQTVKVGESVTFSITENSGYVLQDFTINGGKIVVSSSKNGYTYTLNMVISDVVAKATFTDPNVTVNLDLDGGIGDITSLNATFGKPIGELPVPYKPEHRFIGWFDENGNAVNKTTLISKSGSITLKAKWGQVDSSIVQGLTPYSITATYFDSESTKYGVVWHTDKLPVASVIQVVEKPADSDFIKDENGAIIFPNSDYINCSSGQFLSHYISTGVVDGLKFDTHYAIRVGDIVCNKWSDVYEFTTRKEVVEETKFIFVTDTQEDGSLGNRGGSELYKDGQLVKETYYQNVLKEAFLRFADADFIAHGGDLVNYGSVETYVREMLDSVQDYSFKYPTQITSGNHEGMEYGANLENLSVLYNYDTQSSREVKGDLYSFNYGTVHFVVLRSNDIYDPSGDSFNFKMKLDDAQIDWLKADLSKVDRAKTPWVVCMMHESFVNMSTYYYQPQRLASQLLPILTDYGVDLMLYGHNHRNITTYPIYNDYALTEPTFFGAKLKASTTKTNTVEFDGVMVEEYDFTGVDSAKRGTVFHQTSTGGYQFNSAAKWENRLDIDGSDLNKLKTDPEDSTQFTDLKFIRMVYDGGASCFNSMFNDDGTLKAGAPNVQKGKNYSMYSYIQATKDRLVLRTYGVDVKGLVADTTGKQATDFGVYMEGFMLKK